MPFDGTLDDRAMVLREALRLIQDHGWTQKTNRDENGYCMLGAIAAVTGIRRVFDPAMQPYAELLGFPTPGQAVGWNDSLAFFGKYRVCKRLRRALIDA